MARLGSENMNFEQAWAGAFDNTVMSPSPEVWMKLDSHLANAEARNNKGRLLFFQLLAAASFSLAMGIGIYSYLGDNSIAPVAESISETSHPEKETSETAGQGLTPIEDQSLQEP